jgi:hypothetical protein
VLLFLIEISVRCFFLTHPSLSSPLQLLSLLLLLGIKQVGFGLMLCCPVCLSPSLLLAVCPSPPRASYISAGACLSPRYPPHHHTPPSASPCPNNTLP